MERFSFIQTGTKIHFLCGQHRKVKMCTEPYHTAGKIIRYKIANQDKESSSSVNEYGLSDSLKAALITGAGHRVQLHKLRCITGSIWTTTAYFLVLPMSCVFQNFPTVRIYVNSVAGT
jgi:hypothetical protein